MDHLNHSLLAGSKAFASPIRHIRQGAPGALAWLIKAKPHKQSWYTQVKADPSQVAETLRKKKQHWLRSNMTRCCKGQASAGTATCQFLSAEDSLYCSKSVKPQSALGVLISNSTWGQTSRGHY